MSQIKNYAYRLIKEKKQIAEDKVFYLLEELRKDDVFRSLESQRNGLTFEMARLRAQKADLGNRNELLKDLKEKISLRIAELGHSDDELVVKYACNACKDTGIINGTECECVKKLVYDLLRQECDNLVTDVDSFLKVAIPKETTANYANYLKLLDRLQEVFPNNERKVITLSGTVGTGKTYLASVFANAIMKKGYSAYALNSIQLNSLFLKYHLAPLQEKNEIFEELIDADLLIIDDLGVEPILNNVTIPYLYELLIMRKDKTTIFTTNLDAESIRSRYGDRIFSRIFNVNTTWALTLTGQDLRLKPKNQCLFNSIYTYYSFANW